MRVAFRASVALSAVASCAALASAAACGGAQFTSASDGDASSGALEAGSGSTPDAASTDAGTWCEREDTGHTLCDDFDGKPFLSNGWEQVEVNQGIAADERSTFVSAPNAFESQALASTAVSPLGVSNYGRLQKTFPAGSRFDVAFEMDLDAVPDQAKVTGGDSLVELDFGGGHTVGIYANSDTVGLFESVTPDAGPLGDAGTTTTSHEISAVGDFLSTWKHVILSVGIEPRTVTTSGGPTLTYPLVFPDVSPTLYLGASSRNVDDVLHAYFDDVTVDVYL